MATIIITKAQVNRIVDALDGCELDQQLKIESTNLHDGTVIAIDYVGDGDDNTVLISGAGDCQPLEELRS